MTWTGLFSTADDQIIAVLPVALPVAIGIFAIGLALRYSKRVLKMFA